MRAQEFQPKKLVIFDIDDTLVHTQTKVNVVKDGQVTKELNSHDFTHYKLQPGEQFDFENFRNAHDFFHNSKPIIPMMDQLKNDIATGNKVVMVTARADFDDRELFLDTFRKYGVDIDRVHVYRAGNMTGKMQTEEKKKIIIRNLLDKGNYTKAIMYDDAVPNLDSFVELKDEYASTKFYAWHVSLEGEASEYHRTNETLEERKKKRRVRNAAYGPGLYGGYGYFSTYGNSDSTGGDGGGDGGGESIHENITPNTIHKLADRKGVKWDNEPSFLRLTKRLTGKEHLDDLDQVGLQKVQRHLEKQGVAEGKDFDRCFDQACKLYDQAVNKNLKPKLVQVADFQGDGNGADARWMKLSQHVWQHYVVIVGDQVLDPTAKQFGDSMPTQYQVSDLDRLWGKQYQIRPRQGVAEGKLIESAVFLNPTTVIVGQAHGQSLELSPNTLKQIQAIAAKHGAYYEGNGTDRAYTKGQIDRYVGSWDDEVAKTASPNDPKWLYVLFANVDANNRVQRVGVDPKDTIFNRLLATAKDNSFQSIGYTSQALQKFLQMSSEGKYDFVKMSQQPATQENLTRFLKAGEALMWPNNWEQYPNKAGKIAKAATVDVRDQYLATREAGVYVTGSGHLKAVQNITGKQGVAEDN